MKTTHCAAAAAAAALVLGITTSARAQTFDVKPGLWENTQTTQVSGTSPVDLSSAPPEMRARIEAAMKRREAMGAQTRKYQSCVTQKQLDENAGDFAKVQHCTTHFTQRTSTHVAGTMRCNQDNVTSTGDFDYEAHGRENVSGFGHVAMAGPGGSMRNAIKLTSHWLGSDCKGVSPNH